MADRLGVLKTPRCVGLRKGSDFERGMEKRQGVTTGESLSESQRVTNSRPYHTRKRDLVGKPDAGNPHVRFDERGTGNAAKGVELRPGAKMTDKLPYPTAGAPPDSTPESNFTKNL